MLNKCGQKTELAAGDHHGLAVLEKGAGRKIEHVLPEAHLAAFRHRRPCRDSAAAAQHGLDCRSCAEKADFIEVIKKGLGLKDEL